MSRALQQGLLGRGQRSLQGSEFALGPNRYLGEADFLKMLALALLAHAAVFLVASMLPSQKVTEIPVRALNFRLGDGERVAPLQGVGVDLQMAPQIAAPAMQASSDESWRASAASPAPVVPAPLRQVPHPQPKPQPKPQPVKPSFLAPKQEVNERVAPTENPPPDTISPAAPANLPNPALLAQPAIAPNPQQYVREVGAAPQPSAGAGDSAAQAAAEQIRARYEQQISGWIQMHKYYPANAGGRAGRVVVRMRIDRSGVIRYYAIERSSGVAMLDAAAIDMVRRANPVPAVPVDYPAGSLIEFLIPLNFAP